VINPVAGNLNKVMPGLLAVALLSLWAAPASAVPVFFNNRAAFDAAAGAGLSFEGFEADFGVAATVAFADFTVSETLGINALGQLRDFPGIVNGITEGTGGLVYDDNGDSISTFFAFTSPITAFGLDITTNPGSTVTGGGSGNDSVVLATNQPMFWGVIDSAGLTTITFDASGGPNVAFDAVSYGQAVPEPASVLLLGLGLAALRLGKRSRTR